MTMICRLLFRSGKSFIKIRLLTSTLALCPVSAKAWCLSNHVGVGVVLGGDELITSPDVEENGGVRSFQV